MNPNWSPSPLLLHVYEKDQVNKINSYIYVDLSTYNDMFVYILKAFPTHISSRHHHQLSIQQSKKIVQKWEKYVLTSFKQKMREMCPDSIM